MGKKKNVGGREFSGENDYVVLPTERIVIDQSCDGQVYDRQLSGEEIALMYHKGMEMKECVPIWYKDTVGKWVHIVISWDRVIGKIYKYVNGVKLLPGDATVVVGSIVIQ